MRKHLVSGSDTLITFSEYPVGTSISGQYQSLGILFGGDSPFITTDGANPSSPVLSGTPLFQGKITGAFVTPSGKPRTVGNFSLDVGYIDTPGSVQVTAYGAKGQKVKVVPVDQEGIVTVTVKATGIASFLVAGVSAEPAGFAIDNVSFPPVPFTITGHRALPTPPSPPDPNSEFAEGSKSLAATCSKTTATADHYIGLGVAEGFQAAGAPNGASLLTHFLEGSGTSDELADGSQLSEETKEDPIFKQLDQVVTRKAKQLLDSGQTDVNVTPATYNPDFSSSSATTDLRLAFGGTQGLDVKGNGKIADGYYDGTITYTIRDIYGFYAKNKFLYIGPEMHYLQGVCGAPWHPGGAHWFADSVTVTIPFHQPVGP